MVGDEKYLEGCSAVSYDEGRGFVDVLFIGTTAKDANKVEDAFMQATLEICDKIDLQLIGMGRMSFCACLHSLLLKFSAQTLFRHKKDKQ